MVFCGVVIQVRAKNKSQKTDIEDSIKHKGKMENSNKNHFIQKI